VVASPLAAPTPGADARGAVDSHTRTAVYTPERGWYVIGSFAFTRRQTMQRTQLRLIVVTLALASLAWVCYRVADTLTNRRQRAGGSVLRLLPDAALRLHDFQRVKLEHGRTVWQLSAREAQYFEEGNRAVVKEPQMVFYAEGGEKASIAGEEGNLSFDGKDLRSVEMCGMVRVEGSGYVLETDSATYERDRDVIMAAGPVRILGHNLAVRGSDMEISVSTHRLTLQHEVHVTLTNADGNRS